MSALLTAAGERRVTVPIGRPGLPGLLAWPDHPSGLVLFAHGSGSSRVSPRNQAVARQLRAAGLATLLFDLLTLAVWFDRTEAVTPLRGPAAPGLPETYPFGL